MKHTSIFSIVEKYVLWGRKRVVRVYIGAFVFCGTLKPNMIQNAFNPSASFSR
jgi:hypothetical protein